MARRQRRVAEVLFRLQRRLPTSSLGANALPEIAKFPDGDVVLTQPQFAEAPYPWAADQPRWAHADGARRRAGGDPVPADALKQAQAETDAWLAEQAAKS